MDNSFQWVLILLALGVAVYGAYRTHTQDANPIQFVAPVRPADKLVILLHELGTAQIDVLLVPDDGTVVTHRQLGGFEVLPGQHEFSRVLRREGSGAQYEFNFSGGSGALLLGVEELIPGWQVHVTVLEQLHFRLERWRTFALTTRRSV